MPNKEYRQSRRQRSRASSGTSSGVANSDYDHVYGVNAVADLLTHTPGRIVTLYLSSGRSDKRLQSLVELAAQQGVDYQSVPREQLDDLVSAVHQGVVARVHPSQEKNEEFLDALVAQQLADSGAQSGLLLLVLDGVTDPQNLGACLRSADAAGAQAVIVPKDNAASLTAAARKVASGAAETTPVIAVTNLSRCLKKLKKAGVWIMGAAGETETSLYAIDFRPPCAIVMGAEGKGLRRLTRETCDQVFAIPMPGNVESLNVSVAAGVCLFEAVRQRAQ